MAEQISESKPTRRQRLTITENGEKKYSTRSWLNFAVCDGKARFIQVLRKCHDTWVQPQPTSGVRSDTLEPLSWLKFKSRQLLLPLRVAARNSGAEPAVARSWGLPF